MAAAKKKAASKGAASGPVVEETTPAAAPVTPPAAPPAAAPVTPPTAATPPAETGKRKKKWDVVENKIEYVILLNGKNAVRALCASKNGVIRSLEGMAAKEREKAYVFKLVPIALKTKVSVEWSDEVAE